MTVPGYFPPVAPPAPTWTWDTSILNPSAKPNPFTERKPADPPKLFAVKLTKANFAEVVYRMVQQSTLGVYAHLDREVITFGQEIFKLDQWIVEDSSKYRHPTEQEVKTYGLV